MKPRSQKIEDEAVLKTLILAAIDQRYQAHATKNLADYMFSNYLFQSCEPAFIDFAYQNRQAIVTYLSDEGQRQALAAYCIRATKAYTYQRNQFINYNKFYDELVTAEYSDFFVQTKIILAQADSPKTLSRAYAGILKKHHERLRLILSSYCLAYHQGDLKENPLLNTLLCEEYSARLQLRLLQLDTPQLTEPILDIGCGAKGALVNYLRSQGYVAFGLDRLAPESPHFFQQDWFDFDYGADTWGTVVAHQSFSTHFIYAHLHQANTTQQFAQLYLKILAGLKGGGQFCYAPGLPFFEDYVKEMARYSLVKTTIAAENALGIGEIFYSVKLQKKRVTPFDE